MGATLSYTWICTMCMKWFSSVLQNKGEPKSLRWETMLHDNALPPSVPPSEVAGMRCSLGPRGAGRHTATTQRRARVNRWGFRCALKADRPGSAGPRAGLHSRVLIFSLTVLCPWAPRLQTFSPWSPMPWRICDGGPVLRRIPREGERTHFNSTWLCKRLHLLQFVHSGAGTARRAQVWQPERANTQKILFRLSLVQAQVHPNTLI